MTERRVVSTGRVVRGQQLRGKADEEYGDYEKILRGSVERRRVGNGY